MTEEMDCLRICLIVLLAMGLPLEGPVSAESPGGVPEVILVAAQGANRVVLIEPGTATPRQVVRVEDGPSGIALTPSGETVAILHAGDAKSGHTVTLFSLRLGRVLRVVDLIDKEQPEESLFGPCAAAFESSGAGLLLCVENSSHLYRISTDTGSLLPLLDLGERGASDMVVARDGRHAWVCFAESGTLAVCDLMRGRVLRRIPLGGGPSSLALHPEGHELWATNSLTNSISVVDLVGNREVLEFPVGSQPWDAEFTPDGSKVLVIHRHGGSATLFDSKRRAVLAEISLGPMVQVELGVVKSLQDMLAGVGVLPSALAIAPEGQVAHVTCEGSDELLILGLAPLSIKRRIPMGKRPTAVCHAVIGTKAGS
jgi:YVTN family beta-propeller protein